MNTMKVQIKDLKPNPFRNMDNYPISEEKVDSLIESIKQTGFWDNILARKANGHIQIAYGHHRLHALKLVYPPDYEVEIPIKELDDELMLKIMANENMTDYDTSIAVIDETVKAVRDFLNCHDNLQVSEAQAVNISRFLGHGWGQVKVAQSLSRMNAIKDGLVDQETVQSITTQSGAAKFTAAVKRQGLNKEQQKELANEIKEQKVTIDNIPSTAWHIKHGDKPKPKKKKPTVEDKLIDFAGDLLNISIITKEIIKYHQDINPKVMAIAYAQIKSTNKIFNELINKVENEK